MVFNDVTATYCYDNEDDDDDYDDDDNDDVTMMWWWWWWWDDDVMWVIIAGQNGGTFYMFCEKAIDLGGCYPSQRWCDGVEVVVMMMT